MEKLDAGVSIRGEVRVEDDVIVECRIDGPVWAEGRSITIAPMARVSGDITGREITVLGDVDGLLLATELVDVRASAQVNGRIISPRFILEEGGFFKGKVQPQHLHAALSVARRRSAS